MPKFQRGVPEARSTEKRPKVWISCFRALWDGTCITCDEPIYEGDDIGYIGKNADGVSCNQCILDAENEVDKSS